MTNTSPPEAPQSGRSTHKHSSIGPTSIDRRPSLTELPPRRGLLQNLRSDLPASLVVVFVALPLCLGIALASGAPPVAGLVTGIVGGILVGALSGSNLAVSGPAAGLTVIVFTAIEAVGYEGFLIAGVLAGGLQIALGFLRAGLFAHYFPSSVIKGMLSAIGIILILKQIPHAVGYDSDYEGDLGFAQADSHNTFTGVIAALAQIQPGAIAISLLGLATLILADRSAFWKKHRWLPAPLIVVILGVAVENLIGRFSPNLALSHESLVAIPTGGLTDLLADLPAPAWTRALDGDVWRVAVTLAIVASLETLLCLEAMDKLDPWKRKTPTNRELVAQGVGNMAAATLGGIPMTAVIVRGAANVQSGARTRMSAIAHGVWLLVAVLAFPAIVNMIPLAALAAILIHVGYKLTPIRLMRHMAHQSSDQWMPFGVTVVAILLTDLLTGVGIGTVVGLLFILKSDLQTAYLIERSKADDGRNEVKITLSETVSFLNKAAISRALASMPHGASVEIDGRPSRYIHPDVIELIRDFKDTATGRDLHVTLHAIPDADHAPGH